MSNYQDIRHLIKTGDMLLFRNHPGGSLRNIFERWLITKATASPYVHVGIAWADENRRMWVMDLTTKGCAPRLLSEAGDFDWAPSPKALTEYALCYAHSCFGEWIYSRWQAFLGYFGWLNIGQDLAGQCAEYALSVWKIDGMQPTDLPTPSACSSLANWPNSSITRVTNKKGA